MFSAYNYIINNLYNRYITNEAIIVAKDLELLLLTGLKSMNNNDLNKKLESKSFQRFKELINQYDLEL